ncbi:hypothetical protein A4A49_01805 [Nicotiana attenuata]|uniref:Retrovirus-related pol polyprotein from transposon tnt 1-94 n=1 Tax=Nicotiana attenuata TaxID=49451 RepID=A0A1J6IR97_NICAT|nr:hypothetical protein A4A49_01805 [Nicotiana attenuata]
MFMFPNLIEPNMIRKQENIYLLAMTLIGRVGGVWIQRQKNFTTSRDVVFDEVSSPFSAQKSVALGDNHDNLELLFPEVNAQASGNKEAENESPYQNISREEDGEQEAVRRSTREKKQPGYLKDYEVELNNHSVTSCFFTGALSADQEPLSYEEAKSFPHWERAMQEEIDALDKNETWELVAKPEKCERVT